MKIRRWFGSALVALAILCAPAWADKTVNLHPSAAETTTANGPLTFDTSGYSYMKCGMSITAGSGTVTGFSLWTQGSFDNGATWFDLLTDAGLTTAAGTAGTATTATYSAPRREIYVATAVQTSVQAIARFQAYVPPLIRASWAITGTTPSETFALWCTLMGT